ncbi:hypothetical protein HHI36_022582 [Cryptolaemus montrouzieri]|uniref:C2H2-type domain-containing protein n=1 Tax=Cryptolaemus montrouzieri TaxID=559131 RepID=A0ABD2N1G9_9CUCU
MVICICGKNFASDEGLRTHIRRLWCRGPPQDNNTNNCSTCGRDFNTYAGLRQHVRRAHPAVYNHELETRYEEHDRVEKWTDEDYIRMANLEIVYQGRFINQYLLP